MMSLICAEDHDPQAQIETQVIVRESLAHQVKRKGRL